MDRARWVVSSFLEIVNIATFASSWDQLQETPTALKVIAHSSILASLGACNQSWRYFSTLSL